MTNHAHLRPQAFVGLRSVRWASLQLAAVLLCDCVGVAPTSAAVAAERLPTLTSKQARFYSKVALQRNFEGMFYAGGFKVRDCTRRSRVRVRCQVGWFQGDYSFFGNTVIWLTAARDGTIHWNYAYGVSRLDTYCFQVLKKSEASCTKTYRVR